ncbi:MAG: hypothetical protein MJ237_01415 [bacterium]|nr:hypothetical protein [bacterium]
MRNKQQYEQLMLQYSQIKTCSENISKMIDSERFDEAITLLKSREALFLNCKCIQKYLTLTVEQKNNVDEIVSQIRELEKKNISMLAENMAVVKEQISEAKRNEKLLHAYDFDEKHIGSILNLEE